MFWPERLYIQLSHNSGILSISYILCIHYTGWPTTFLGVTAFLVRGVLILGAYVAGTPSYEGLGLTTLGFLDGAGIFLIRYL